MTAGPAVSTGHVAHDTAAPWWRDAGRWAPALLPAALLLVGGWSHRWVNEDAFINLRVVEQVFAGNGPVFNAGERVEAFTSPLWLLVLVLARGSLGLVLRMEWTTVVVTLATSTAAFGVAGVVARRLNPGERVVVPLGVALVAAVPVVWDFASAGLETGLAWLWLATSWLVLVRAAGGQGTTGRARTAALVVLGLGPLVRPDLALTAGAALVGWLAVVRPRGRRLLLDLAVTGALPVGYQVFRMGYYANLVPNTALAKSAGGRRLGDGLEYAADLVDPYWLWVPVTLMAVAIVATLRRVGRPVATVAAAMLIGAALNGAYVVYVGGDYMHGRLLLPALFGLAVPAVVVVDRRRPTWAAVLAIGTVWLVTCVGWLRYPEKEPTVFSVAPISDWRALQEGPRVVVGETDSDVIVSGSQLRRRAENGERGLIRKWTADVVATEVVPTEEGDRLLAVVGSIGLTGYRAGTDVWIVDIGGLAEPLAARTRPIPGRAAGHQKEVDPAWYEGRFAVVGRDRDAEAAARALRCEPLSDLMAAISEPITPGRFLSNVWRSAELTGLDVPADPAVAERRFCGE